MSDDVEQVYRAYYPPLVRYLTSLCGDAEVAQDVAQDTFLQVLKHIDTFDGRSSFQTWLFSIGKRELARHYRKRTREAPVEQEDQELTGEGVEPGAPGSIQVETYALDELQAEEITRALAALEEPLRTIAQLRLFEELPFKTIATQVQRSEVYCRVAFFRIRQTLRKEYQS